MARHLRRPLHLRRPQHLRRPLRRRQHLRLHLHLHLHLRRHLHLHLHLHRRQHLRRTCASAVGGATTAQPSSVVLSAPEAVTGSNRIALRWTAGATSLRYSVLLRPSAGMAYRMVADDLAGTSTVIARGAAWALDFPSALVKLRSCTAGGQCVDSNEQPLLSALMGGIVALRSVTPDRVWNVNDPNSPSAPIDYFSRPSHLMAAATRWPRQR